jgi:uncharacterized membrane protein YidH (DUF202 family)
LAKKENYNSLIGISTLAAFIASLCCISPVLLVLFGASSISFAAALDTQLDTNFEIFFILAGIATLFVGVWYLKQSNKIYLGKYNHITDVLIVGLVMFVVAYLIIHNIIANYAETALGFDLYSSYVP